MKLPGRGLCPPCIGEAGAETDEELTVVVMAPTPGPLAPICAPPAVVKVAPPSVTPEMPPATPNVRNAVVGVVASRGIDVIV